MRAIRWLTLGCLSALTGVLLTGPAAGKAAAAVPYESYTYNYWMDDVKSPSPYLPVKTVEGQSLGLGAFNEPKDLVVDAAGDVYVLDSGNSRIVVLDRDLRPKRTIDSFDNGGKQDRLNEPGGIALAPDGTVYVADTGNSRVVAIGAGGELVRTIANPKSDLLGDGFKFTPLKLAVDRSNRVFVIAQGAFEGILQFDADGTFMGYVGTNKVSFNAEDYLWKTLSTKTQRDKMILFVPTEFSGISLDQRGFVYATNVDENSEDLVKRLNPSGEDTLKRLGYFSVSGDLRYSSTGVNGGPSNLVDVAVRDKGIYSVLDSRRGRVFTYDREGDLLYVFGQMGTQAGTFQQPVAIDAFRDRIYVLDSGKARIHVFQETLFGSLVDRATGLHFEGKDQEAAAGWRQVLRLNSNYDLAYIGLGKAQLRNQQYKEAMHSFKLGMNRTYYSAAYKRYRKAFVREHFEAGFASLLALLAAIVAYRLVRRRRMGKRGAHETGVH